MSCEGRGTLPPPSGVASDCSATVAVPLCAPAMAVLRPATRLVVSIAPGANRLTVPLFEVAGPTAEICASRLACGGVPAILVTLSACCCRLLILTLPKSIEVGEMLGFAGFTTDPLNVQR